MKQLLTILILISSSFTLKAQQPINLYDSLKNDFKQVVEVLKSPTSQVFAAHKAWVIDDGKRDVVIFAIVFVLTLITAGVFHKLYKKTNYDDWMNARGVTLVVAGVLLVLNIIFIARYNMILKNPDYYAMKSIEHSIRHITKD